MELSNREKSQCRFHLGYNVGAQIPAGDIARLEEAMARIPDQFFYDAIIGHLNRCQRAWDISEVFRSDVAPQPSRVERITGDTERAIFFSDPIKAARDYREVYLLETDHLAETLYVANYRREDARRFAFDRSGGEFINAVPGPADTAVGTRIAQHTGILNWR